MKTFDVVHFPECGMRAKHLKVTNFIVGDDNKRLRAASSSDGAVVVTVTPDLATERVLEGAQKTFNLPGNGYIVIIN